MSKIKNSHIFEIIDNQRTAIEGESYKSGVIRIHDKKLTPIKIDNGSILHRDILKMLSGKTNDTYSPDISFRYVKYLGAYYVLSGDSSITIGESTNMVNTVHESKHDDELSIIGITPNTPMVILHNSTLRVRELTKGVTGVSILANSVIDSSNVFGLTYATLLSSVIVGRYLDMISTYLYSAVLYGKDINTYDISLHYVRITATKGNITLYGLHTNPLTDGDVIPDDMCVVGELTVDNLKSTTESCITLPVFNCNNECVSVDICDRFDYGEFTAKTSLPFYRCDRYNIVVGDYYIDTDKFTLFAQAYCDELGIDHYVYNGQKMLTQDIIVDDTIKLKRGDYSSMMKNIMRLALASDDIKYDKDVVHDEVTSLIFQIRSRTNVYKQYVMNIQ